MRFREPTDDSLADVASGAEAPVNFSPWLARLKAVPFPVLFYSELPRRH
jgi:hypothetical protein